MVEPASIRMLPVRPWGMRARAASAIRVFSGCRWTVRSRMLSSVVLKRSGETAPPCTRRTLPEASRAARSRRMVSVVMLKRSARSVTLARPLA